MRALDLAEELTKNADRYGNYEIVDTDLKMIEKVKFSILTGKPGQFNNFMETVFILSNVKEKQK